MKFKRIVILVLIMVCCSALKAQNQHSIDSLKTVLLTFDNDIEHVSTLLELTDQLINNNPNEALDYATQALEIAEQNNFTLAIAKSLNKISKINFGKGTLKIAMSMAFRALEISEENDLEQEVIIAQNNIGFIYNKLGDYDKSSKYFFECLKLSEDLGEAELIATSLNSIGYSYFDQKNYEKAFEYYSKSLDIAREANIKIRISSGLNNVAAALGKLGDYEQYRSYVVQAIKINKEIGQSRFLTINYMNLGLYYKMVENADSSKFYYQMALDLAREIDNVPLELRVRTNMASLNLSQGDIDMSLSEALDILQIAEKRGFKKDIYYISNLLKTIYISNNDFENANKFISLGYAMKDSLDLDDKITELSKLELLYELEKDDQVQKANQQRKDFIYLLIGISLLFIIVVVISSLRRNKMKSRISNLEKYKLQDELDFKNKELTINVMSLMKKNELLNQFSLQLLEIEQDAVSDKTKNSIHRVSKELQKSIESEIWGEFEKRFKEVHSDFYNTLIEKYPDLTPNELRLSAFLRLNMSTKEISELTGQTINAIEMGRFRLRKKLFISGTDENLIIFLSQI